MRDSSTSRESQVVRVANDCAQVVCVSNEGESALPKKTEGGGDKEGIIKNDCCYTLEVEGKD